ncbi:alpha/beta hydrolase [Bradyrhizobium jicamae]|uniref:Alpha/beta hydrolase n=1 Tax=Bradyrhizobium jicamae TaxID=280332 RepID=A0ABS5FB31_9BRAD|nr:alpha/beta hydrolase [Bradyrhizobium jicamae]MBR0793991.1 alpha/beta hydrolase [Bradyrhizobium jicamae]MBR0932154.1 alpha/beta hydrolase [Bradyrhizobium jicamae]
MHHRARLATLALLLAMVARATAAPRTETERHEKPVKEVAGTRIAVGTATFPLYLSADWSNPLPNVTRAVLVLHGVLRNADDYFRSALEAQAAAGDIGKSTLMIAPQFLTQADADAFKLPAETLRWSLVGWEGGDPALAPEPVSSFEALDAILAKLGDRKLFPNLKQVVVFGHSGGGQVVQRYAIAVKGDRGLLNEGIGVRYVVANPSSYAYFSKDRPEPAIAASCAGYNNWKFGMDERPTYLAEPAPAALEQAYVARRVIYLLGTLDTDPNHPALDKSCMAEAEGPYRYARGHAYVATMKSRDDGTPNHSQWDVPGVGHEGGKMLTSPCGLTAVFDIPGCAAAR